MSTIRETTELGPVTARRQVYSPLETYWNAFQEWRKRRRSLANLCDLSDRELMDIGITRSEIDYLASHRDPFRHGSFLHNNLESTMEVKR